MQGVLKCAEVLGAAAGGDGIVPKPVRRCLGSDRRCTAEKREGEGVGFRHDLPQFHRTAASVRSANENAGKYKNDEKFHGFL